MFHKVITYAGTLYFNTREEAERVNSLLTDVLGTTFIETTDEAPPGTAG